MRSLAWIPLALLSACDGNPGLDDQLEDVEFFLVDRDLAEGTEATASGRLTVSGGDGDFALQLATALGAVELDLHSPGRSDLGRLDSRGVSMTFVDGSEGSQLVLEDEEGVAYAAFGAGTSPDAINQLLGEDALRYGEEGESESQDGTRFVFSSVVVEADDRAYELWPGEATHLELGGELYRVVVLHAYTAEPSSVLAGGCLSGLDSLSLEILRIDSGGYEDEQVLPSTDAGPSLLGVCG